jgi:hypothetical protein
MDIILSQNAWSNQLQASKLLILKPLDSFVKLGFGQNCASPSTAQAHFQSQCVPLPITKRKEKSQLRPPSDHLFQNSIFQSASHRLAKICKYGSHGLEVTVAEDI